MPRRTAKPKPEATGKKRHRKATQTKRADYTLFPKTIKEYTHYNAIADKLREDELVSLYWQVTGKPVPVDGTANVKNLPIIMTNWYDPIDSWSRWLHRVIVMNYLLTLKEKAVKHAYYQKALQWLHEPKQVPEVSLLSLASINELEKQGVKIMRSENTTTTTTDVTPNAKPSRKSAKRGSRTPKETPATTKGRKTTKAESKATKAEQAKRTPKQAAKPRQQSNGDNPNRVDEETMKKQRIVAVKGACESRGWMGDVHSALEKAGAKGMTREAFAKVVTKVVEERGAKREPDALVREAFLTCPRLGFATVKIVK